jgi:peptidoglycan hydrolase FlgJ
MGSYRRKTLRNIYRKLRHGAPVHTRRRRALEIQPVNHPGSGAQPSLPGPARESAAREAARAFEATYLAEMLKHTGLNTRPDTFGGGAGEDAFASFLNAEYARLLAARGGIGLAERIFQAITGGDDPR